MNDLEDATIRSVVSVVTPMMTLVQVIPVDGVNGAVRILKHVEDLRPSIVEVHEVRSVVRDVANQPLVTITTPHVTTDRSSDQRTIPPGGAAIYRFGERAYALTTEVLDDSKAKP